MIKMIFRQICAVLVLTVLFFPSIGRTDEFRPSTYDECITDSMKGVASDVAASAILSSCRNRFPEQIAVAPLQEDIAPKQETVAPEQEAVASEQKKVESGTGRSLTPEEFDRLTASAFVFSDSYRLTVRNGNESLTISELTIAVWNNSNPDGRRTYSQDVRIPPLQSESVKYTVVYEGRGFEIDLTENSEPSWEIVGAKGID